MLKKLALLTMTIAVAASLSACGRRGALEAPGTYDAQQAGTAGQEQKKPAGDHAFILDPLL